MSPPLATHDFTPTDLPAALEFLKRTRWELRELRMVRVWTDHFQVIDVNKDLFEVRGVGYPDANVVTLLRVNTAFDPATIHDPTDAGTRSSSPPPPHLGRRPRDVRTNATTASHRGTNVNSLNTAGKNNSRCVQSRGAILPPTASFGSRERFTVRDSAPLFTHALRFRGVSLSRLI